MNYNTIINNLKVLSTVQNNDRIIVDNLELEIDNRYFLPVRRYINGISRSDIIEPILITYKSLFLYINIPRKLENNSDDLINYLNNMTYIKNLIKNSINGLIVLLNTYDNKFDSLSNLIKWIIKEHLHLQLNYSIITNSI